MLASLYAAMTIVSSESVAQLLATPGLKVADLTSFILNVSATAAMAAAPQPVFDGRHCSDGLCGCTPADLMNNLNAGCSLINGGAWARPLS